MMRMMKVGSRDDQSHVVTQRLNSCGAVPHSSGSVCDLMYLPAVLVVSALA